MRPLITTSDMLKVTYFLTFSIVFLLIYKGIFVLNEEVLVAICFILFIIMSVYLFTDTLKASMLERVTAIKIKFETLRSSIANEIEIAKKNINSDNIENEINFLIDEVYNDLIIVEKEKETLSEKEYSELKKEYPIFEILDENISTDLSLIQKSKHQLYLKLGYIFEAIQYISLFVHLKKIKAFEINFLNTYFDYMKYIEYNTAYKVYENLSKQQIAEYHNRLKSGNIDKNKFKKKIK